MFVVCDCENKISVHKSILVS